MSCTRLSALAFVVVLVAVTGCGPADTSLLGQPLVGSIDTSLDETSVGFSFDALGFELDNCPSLDAGAVTFDGVVNEDPIDPYSPPGLLVGARCYGLSLRFDVDSPDVATDAELVVESGVDDDVVRYEAVGLHANRRVEVQGSSRVSSGGSLNLRYMTPEDGLGPISVRAETSDLLPVSEFDDLIEIVLPTWLPTGEHELRVEVPYTVQTRTCEGFASCNVTGSIVQTIPVTVVAGS